MKHEPLNTLSEDIQVRAMAHLWTHMGGLYGEHWYRSYGDVEGSPIGIWKQALGRFSMEQIKRGLHWVNQSVDSFPPTLPQFTNFCLTVRPEDKPNFT